MEPTASLTPRQQGEDAARRRIEAGRWKRIGATCFPDMLGVCVAEILKSYTPAQLAEFRAGFQSTMEEGTS